MAYITCADVTLGYEGQAVTRGLNFEVNKGDYLCIVGENGAGKSTLMKTILHLIKPVSGEIMYGDGLTEKKIGYLPQHTQVQKDFPASVYEIVLSGNLSRIGHRFFYSQAEKNRTRQMLEKMGIWDLRNKCYRNLSGGQQQRVLLARALCAASGLIVLDEPVTGLDPIATEELYELIKKINEEGMSIVMVSHDVHTATRAASHILQIGGKEQLFFGTRDEYVKSTAYAGFAPAVQDAGLIMNARMEARRSTWNSNRIHKAVRRGEMIEGKSGNNAEEDFEYGSAKSQMRREEQNADH